MSQTRLEALCFVSLRLTFNVELVSGDLDAVVDKLGELQKMSGCISCNSSCRSAGAVRESAFEDAGSGRAEDARQQVAQVAVRGESRLGPLGGGEGARRRGGSARRRIGSRRRADREPAGRAALLLSQSHTWGRAPSARGARAKLLERKPASRRRESEAEFETLACGSGSHLFRET